MKLNSIRSSEVLQFELPVASEMKRKAPSATVTILNPNDAMETLRGLKVHTALTMLDPWYNRGIGGIREDYDAWLAELVKVAGEHSDHVMVWGFPEIIARLLDRLPQSLELITWLTWYYKNCPSVIRGWRSAQYTCLHLARKSAKIYPEHFLNEAQLKLQKEGKLRYMPGPTSVIDVPLNIGFVGRNEQTGHPAQKPEKVIEPLVLMTTKPGDLVIDPMCGSGTTGAVCRRLERNSILCDNSDKYLTLAEKRLGVARTHSAKYSRRNSKISRLTLAGAA